jgi:eukaryotic-like serine/threonine-protein kinase
VTLAAGTRLGPYEILAPLGAGGMGEVYRARDLKLHRDVAIKVLPEAVARDPDRLARFRREAQLLAALNHPHIASIYGLEESAGAQALVLELVEGETVAGRLGRGAMPVEEALAAARQIGDALEAAHEKGIVHRDLKPANVKITPEGSVKVLDFGLAKALAFEGASPDSPTLTATATQAGIVIGTAAYMSPEQARGKSVDKRSDIWSFGAVLYEMLTGRRCFEGETVSDTLAAVLRADIDWTALPRDTPPSVRRVLQRCLERDPKLRLHDVADARLEMDETVPVPEQQSAVAVSTWKRLIPWALVTVLAFVVAAALLRSSRASRRPAPPVVRVSKVLKGVRGTGDTLAISPDGTVVAFVAWDPLTQGRLMLWRMEDGEVRPFGGGGARGKPFFSPDGQWLGIVGARIRKAALSGADIVDVAQAPSDVIYGACWTPSGEIVIGRSHGGLVVVSAAGGELRDLTKADPGFSHCFPQVLPGGRALLFTVSGPKGDLAAVVPISKGKAAGPVREVLSNAEYAQFVPPGHLVFWRGSGPPLAAPFDLQSLSVTGPAAPVLGGASGADYDGSSWLAVSATGTLAYAPHIQVPSLQRLVWVDRSGAEVPLDLPAAEYVDPGISPDGASISYGIAGERSQQIWIHNLKTGASTRLTFERTRHFAPVWTPNGLRTTYCVFETRAVVSRPADGTGLPVTLSPENVKESVLSSLPVSWSPDGRTLAMQTWNGTALGLTLLRCDEAGGVKGPCRFEKLQSADVSEGLPQFSRDGRYLAYVSNESGHNEIYARAFPGPGGKWQVSTAEGTEPRWSRDGRELFYRAGNALMVVPVGSSPGSFGAPKKLFEAPYADVGDVIDYDVGPDGRFLFMKPVEASRELTLELVLNWPTELARQAPPERKK